MQYHLPHQLEKVCRSNVMSLELDLTWNKLNNADLFICDAYIEGKWVGKDRTFEVFGG